MAKKPPTASKPTKPVVRKVVPTPKSVYQTTTKKPEPDNFPARPKGGKAAAKRLKGVPL